MKRCTVAGLSRIAGVSRQSYYKRRKSRHRIELDEDFVLGLVRSIRARHPRMGSSKLLGKLQQSIDEQARSSVIDAAESWDARRSPNP